MVPRIDIGEKGNVQMGDEQVVLCERVSMTIIDCQVDFFSIVKDSCQPSVSLILFDIPVS